MILRQCIRYWNLTGHRQLVACLSYRMDQSIAVVATLVEADPCSVERLQAGSGNAFARGLGIA